MSKKKETGKQKQKSRFKSSLARLLTLAVALSVVFFVGLFIYRLTFSYQYDTSLQEKDLAAGVQADENITNLALFGLDTRAGETQSRSDCIMIVTVDNTRGKIKLISLMRDSLVPIDGYGQDKLNAAYFYGGPSLAIRTINENFGTDIRDYIAVNFEQLAEIINILGGVELDVQDYELNELNRVIRDYGLEQGQEFPAVEQAGLQTLDGVQALCYGRIRKGNTGDDWGRVERQGIVLNALFTKIQSMRATKLVSLAQKLLPYVTTSLSPAEIAPLIVGAVRNGMPQLERTRIPLDGEWVYSGSLSQYISYHIDTAADHIQKYVYDDIFPGASPEQESASSPSSDPAALTEEGGRYDPATGDYYDSDGDRYYLDGDGKKIYY